MIFCIFSKSLEKKKRLLTKCLTEYRVRSPFDLENEVNNLPDAPRQKIGRIGHSASACVLSLAVSGSFKSIHFFDCLLDFFFQFYTSY